MEYMMVNGYQIPALTLNEPPTPEIGKYGSLRRKFLLENAPMMFDEMLLEGTLYPHLAEIVSPTCRVTSAWQSGCFKSCSTNSVPTYELFKLARPPDSTASSITPMSISLCVS